MSLCLVSKVNCSFNGLRKHIANSIKKTQRYYSRVRRYMNFVFKWERQYLIRESAANERDIIHARG